MSAKLDRLRLELEKARAQLERWTMRVAESEAMYTEQENMEICEIVHFYKFSPEQLQEALEIAKTTLPESEAAHTAMEEAEIFEVEEENPHET